MKFYGNPFKRCEKIKLVTKFLLSSLSTQIHKIRLDMKDKIEK